MNFWTMLLVLWLGWMLGYTSGKRTANCTGRQTALNICLDLAEIICFAFLTQCFQQ